MTTIKEELANQSIAKQIAETLDKHYPGHAWMVTADVLQGVVKIYNLELSNEYGYVLHIDTLLNDPSMKITIKAGGEFLERYGLRRGELNRNELADKTIDLRGNVIHDS